MNILNEGEELVEEPKLVLKVKVRRDCDKCSGKGRYSEKSYQDSVRTRECYACDDENKIETVEEREVGAKEVLDIE